MPLNLTYRHTFTSDTMLGRVTDFVALDTPAGPQLFAALEASANIAQFDLGAGAVADMQTDWSVPVRGVAMRPHDLDILEYGGTARLAVTGVETRQIESASLTSAGMVSSSALASLSGGPQTVLSQLAQIDVGARSFVATGSRDGPGLNLYEQTNTSTFVHRATQEDHAKVALADSAALITVTVGDASYVVNGSARDGGISTFSVSASGALDMVDTVGVKQQLWLSGLDDLTTVEAGGTDYVAIAATNSSSLSLVRVNELGVMFVTDHITDDRDSRFSNVDAIDSFAVGARGFVVAGGSDDGVTLFEILPDGTFFKHGSLENQAGGRLEDITALEAVVTGDEVQVFAGSARGDITQLAIDIGNLGAVQTGSAAGSTLTGTTSDDMLLGGAGTDQLRGGGGDDLMIGNGGDDRMWGGDGADTFVFGAGGQGRVMDFELGEDKIDISDWGQIYHLSAVQVRARSDGAEIRYQNEVLRIQTDDNSALDAATLFDSILF